MLIGEYRSGRLVQYEASIVRLLIPSRVAPCRLLRRSGLGRYYWQIALITGLSDILCARPVSSLADEPFAEDDGELGLGLEPLARRPFPFHGSVVENQI